MFLWIFSSLSVIDRNFSAFNKTFSPGLTELVSTCHKKKFEAKLIFIKSLYYKFFRTSIELFSAFCRNFFDEVVKTAFYVSIPTFKKSWKFSDVGQKTIGIFDKLFDRVVKTAFQVYMGTSWAEKLSDENLTFSCSHIERKVFTFVRMFFDWAVRTAFHLAIGLFWEEVSSLRFSLSFSDIEPKFFGIMWIVYQLGFQNCILRVQKNSLSWISSAKFVDFCLSLSDFQTKKILFLAEK